MGLSLAELATRFGCDLSGDPDTIVDRVATLDSATSSALSFLANSAYRSKLRETAAGAVVLKAEDLDDCPVAALVSNTPYVSYAKMAALLHPPIEYPGEIHPTAVAASTATIAESVYIAATAVVGENCQIAERVLIGPGCVLDDNCSIGADTRLIANVCLGPGVRIGERGTIQPGAVIGARGFGFVPTDSGWLDVPQVGSVRIGNDVEIGANTTVDRGAIDDTVLEDGVKLDNLIQIAHNVRVGAHTAMAGMTGIAGSTSIGQRCMFAGSSGAVGHISICDDVVVSARTMVTKDIRKPGTYSGGFPADEASVWRRNVSRFRQLDKLAKRLHKLESWVAKRND